MQFVTDTWQPVRSLEIRSDTLARASIDFPFRSYEARHWLALVGVALFFLAPLAWFASGVWVSATLLVSISLLMVSAATFLVPDVRADFDAPESRED